MEEQNKGTTPAADAVPTVQPQHIIHAFEQRLQAIQATHERHRRQALLLRAELEQAEALRDDAAARLDEVGEQLGFLRGLASKHAASPARQ